jgi:hypothetical protein
MSANRSEELTTDGHGWTQIYIRELRELNQSGKAKKQIVKISEISG